MFSRKIKIIKIVFFIITLLEVECDVRPNVQLQKLREVRISDPFAGIPFDARKLSIALFLAEFLYYSTRGEQHNEALFA